MFEIKTYDLERELPNGTKTNTQVYLCDNVEAGISLELRQTTGSVSLIKYTGLKSQPPGTEFFSSGLMNRPVKILDQWLIDAGAPSFRHIRKSAEKIEAPEQEPVDHERQSRCVQIIKRKIEALEEQCNKDSEGVVFCYVTRIPDEKEPQYGFHYCSQWLPTRKGIEADQREFPEATDSDSVWEEKEEDIPGDAEILEEFQFVTPYEKKEMVRRCGLWIRRAMKV